MEFLDVFDEQYRKVGVASREEVHQKGLWHQTFHCWVVLRDESDTYLVVQRRHSEKDTNPGLLDVSCAGHLMTGEEVEDGIRELEEELGLVTSFEQLVPLDLVREQDVYPVYKNTPRHASQPLIDNEFCHVFYVFSDLQLMNFQPQVEEVSGLYKVKLNEFLDLFRGTTDGIFIRGYQVDENGKKNEEERFVHREDFVARDESYYVGLLSEIEAAD